MKVAKIILIILLLVLVVEIGFIVVNYIGKKSTQPTEDSNAPKNCLMDVKICPDGSSVTRTGPNCEFSPCP